MSTRCPHCGRLLARDVEDEAGRLLAILTAPAGQRRKLDVYRGDRTNRWFVTYGHGEFSAEAVCLLVSRGAILPCYSNTNDAYHVGRTMDVDATLARRKLEGKNAPIVYA